MNLDNQNTKRIAFFLITLHGGGGEKVVLDLAKGFTEDGFSVDLLLFSKEGSFLNKIDSKINIIDLNVSRIFFSILPIIKYLKRESPVFILGTSEHANIILILSKIFSRTKTKILVRVGMTFSDLFKQYKNKKDKLIPFLIKILYPFADTVIANSENVKKDLISVVKISENKIKVIYNPKFISEIIENSKQGEWKFTRDKFTILSIGRLEKQKDFKTLITSFKKVHEKIQSQLIILGEGGEENNLKGMISDLGLEKDIHLLGFVENPYLYMINSDLLVSTSLWEGFSNVLIEASILGLPIVATDCGSGSRELLAPNSGFDNQLKKGNIEYAEYGVLIAKQDIENLSKAILELSNDKNLRQKYSEKLRQRSQIFDVKKILAEYKNLLK